MHDDETELDRASLLNTLRDLKVKHKQLDNEITALRDTGATDAINIARMKKLKLRIKDKIAQLENILTPDIIA